MTNAEAIEYIKKNCYGEWCEDDWREAMDISIKALEAQDILLSMLSDFGSDIPCDELIDDTDEEEICYTICSNYGNNIPPECWRRWALMKAKERKEEVK